MTRPWPALAILASILLSIGSGAALARIGPGNWRIDGEDARLGAYTGELEIRATSSGALEVARVVELLDLEHHDGRLIDLVWTGSVRGADGAAPSLSFPLQRAGFITRVGDLARTEADAWPLAVVGALRADGRGGFEIRYHAPDDPGFSVVERALPIGAAGPDPIFRSGRLVRATHDEPGRLTKAFWFRAFESYHDLPEVRPYTDRSEFRRAVHFQVVEHTDFAYYRAHPDRLRVVDKVVDAISLAETEVRANAFRAEIHDKAAFYQGELTNEFLASHGMVVDSIGAGGRVMPDFSGALWTGIYALTQALRHRATGEEGALDDLRRSLRGIFTLMDITRDPRTFARTLRPTGPPLTGSWRRGSGAFAHLDWMSGGNNDMAKGLLLGMIAGWEALPADDPLRAEIASHALDLLQLCVFMADPPGACDDADARAAALDLDVPTLDLDIPTPDLDLPSINPGAARLLAGLTNGNRTLVDSGLAWLRQSELEASAARGGGPIYVYGISDWSGNHLTLTSTLILQRLLARTDDAELKRLWIDASGEAWRLLRLLEHPLHAALAVASGALADRPDDLRDAGEAAVWGLRSFPFPKHPHPVDHRVRGDFVLSPFPALPWKLDWETNPARRQAIVALPMLEQAIDRYRWNAGHFAIASPGLGARRVPAVDYLFLYWLAREGGLAAPDH